MYLGKGAGVPAAARCHIMRSNAGQGIDDNLCLGLELDSRSLGIVDHACLGVGISQDVRELLQEHEWKAIVCLLLLSHVIRDHASLRRGSTDIESADFSKCHLLGLGIEVP